MAELSRDPDFLAFKEQLGEPLSDSERRFLEEWRRTPQPRAIGGAP